MTVYSSYTHFESDLSLKRSSALKILFLTENDENLRLKVHYLKVYPIPLEFGKKVVRDGHQRMSELI